MRQVELWAPRLIVGFIVLSILAAVLAGCVMFWVSLIGEIV